METLALQLLLLGGRHRLDLGLEHEAHAVSLPRPRAGRGRAGFGSVPNTEPSVVSFGALCLVATPLTGGPPGPTGTAPVFSSSEPELDHTCIRPTLGRCSVRYSSISRFGRVPI